MNGIAPYTAAFDDDYRGYMRDEQEAERAQAERDRRQAKAEGERYSGPGGPLPVVSLPGPMPVIPPPPAPLPGGATPYQLKSNLLGMCATADKYAAAGRTADHLRQLAKIKTVEAKLRAASPEIWPLYERDREDQRQARKCAAIAAEPAPPPAPKPAPPPKPAPVTPPARPDARTTLDCAVEQLVAEYTCGAVIDAAWAAAHRLFRPNSGKERNAA